MLRFKTNVKCCLQANGLPLNYVRQTIRLWKVVGAFVKLGYDHECLRLIEKVSVRAVFATHRAQGKKLAVIIFLSGDAEIK